MPKVYSYVRFSTPQQAAGTSKQRQDDPARMYAANVGQEFDEDLCFEDAGRSAFKGDHLRAGSGLAEFLELAKAGAVSKGSTLVVETYDRLARLPVRQSRDLFESILDCGINVYFTLDHRLFTPETYDMLAMIETLLRFEGAYKASAEKSERVTTAWSIRRQQAAQDGRIITSRAPMWLRIVNGRFKPIPERVKLIRRIFKAAINGQSLTRLAREMNDADMPAWGPGRGGRPALWRPHALKRIVASRAVLGEFVAHTLVCGRCGDKCSKPGHRHQKRVPTGEVIEGYYPAVIDSDTWHKAQDAGAIARGIHASNGEPLRNVLARVCRCAACDGSVGMRATGRKTSSNNNRQLTCRNSRAGGYRCELRPKEATIRMSLVERELLRHARALPEEASGDTKALDAFNAARDALWVLEDDMDDMLRLASDDLPRAREKLHILERERRGALEKLKALKAAAEEASGPLVRHRLHTLRAALLTDPWDRNAINLALRAACTTVVLDFISGMLYLKWRHGGQYTIDLHPGREFFETQ